MGLYQERPADAPRQGHRLGHRGFEQAIASIQRHAINQCKDRYRAFRRQRCRDGLQESVLRIAAREFARESHQEVTVGERRRRGYRHPDPQRMRVDRTRTLHEERSS